MKIPPEGPPRKPAADNPDALDEAMRLLHEGHFKAALKVFQRLTAAHPQDARGWRLVAMSQLALGRAPEALEALTRTLELHRQHGSALEDADIANVYATRALVFLQQDEPGQAGEDAKAALELHPNEPDALLVATVVATGEERLAEAQRFATRLVKLDPESADAHAWLARVLSARGKKGEAAREAVRARELGFTTSELEAIEREGAE